MESCNIKKKLEEIGNVSSVNQKSSSLKNNPPRVVPLTHTSPTCVQNGRESAKLIENYHKSNSRTWEEQLQALKEEVSKGKKLDIEWKKVQRLLELAEKKKQKDIELEKRKKQKEIEQLERRKLKELELAEKKRVRDLELAEKKRQKEIDHAEKKRQREELQKLKRAKSKPVKQQLESLPASITLSQPQQTEKVVNPNDYPNSVSLTMSVTVPDAKPEPQAGDKAAAVPFAVPVAAQSDPIYTGEIGSGTSSENGVKRSKETQSKETQNECKERKEKYSCKQKKKDENDEKKENKKEMNKWGDFFRQCKSCSHIDSTNSSLKSTIGQMESKHTYTKKEKQKISICKRGYVECSNVSEICGTNNSNKDRREAKMKMKEQKKKKKRGNSKDGSVNDIAYTTANCDLSGEQSAPTNNTKDDNINTNNNIRSPTNSSEDPMVKTASSKSSPVVNSSLLMNQRTSNGLNTSKMSKSKKGERGGDNGDNSGLNNAAQPSKGAKSKVKDKNEPQSKTNKNSKTKETIDKKGSKRSTNSIVIVCSTSSQCISNKDSEIEDDIVVKELEKIEKERLERAAGVKKSDAGDCPGAEAKQSLVLCSTRRNKKRQGELGTENSDGIPCTENLEDPCPNPEKCADVTLSHSCKRLVALFICYLKQSLKVMKNFCIIITMDKRQPEVTCATETVGQIMRVFWLMGKEACKYLQCKKIEEKCTNDENEDHSHFEPSMQFCRAKKNNTYCEKIFEIG